MSRQIRRRFPKQARPSSELSASKVRRAIRKRRQIVLQPVVPNEERRKSWALKHARLPHQSARECARRRGAPAWMREWY